MMISLVCAVGLSLAQDKPVLKVTVSGLSDPLLANVTAYLKIHRLSISDRPFPGEARLRWLHNQAESDIRQALQPFGYYQAQITSSLQRTQDGWVAEYQVSPGPRLAISSLDIQLLGEGQEDTQFQQLLAQSGLTVGEPLEHTRYETFKQQLTALATERGYFDARFSKSQIAVDLEAYTAAIELHYDTGRRYRFGEVDFDQSILSAEFLSRYLSFQPGDFYQAPALLALQTALIDSQYFDEVIISAAPDKAVDYLLPVEVMLKPRKKHKFTAGLGYGTDTGIRGRLGVERRWVNRQGHRYEAQLLASQIKYGLAAEYLIPGQNPNTDVFKFRSNVVAEDSDIKDSQTLSFGISHHHRFELWSRTLSLDYHWETFNFGDAEETTQLMIAGANWSRIEANPDQLNVTRGNRISFDVKGSNGFLLSDIAFLQAAVRGKWISPLWTDGRLIVRGDIGGTYIDSDDFDRLPSSLRFFAGGDRSVRGYDLDSIGPRSDADDIIGGRHLLVGSIEYDHRIRDKWSLATFVDMGDAFNNSPELKTGIGVGVRWQSPVGPIRVDLASGLDDPGDTVRLHFSIGPDL